MLLMHLQSLVGCELTCGSGSHFSVSGENPSTEDSEAVEVFSWPPVNRI